LWPLCLIGFLPCSYIGWLSDFFAGAGLMVMRFFFLSMLAVLTVPSFLPLSPAPAWAEVTTQNSCKHSPFAGKWVSENDSENFLVRLDISEKCEKVMTKPVSMNSPWSGMLGRERQYVYREYVIRPYSRCAPANCVWGRAKGKRQGVGALKVSYRMFWSQRYLEMQAASDGRLKVRWRVQYIGRKKPDQYGETMLVRMQ
jgi:hypothetical protein